MHRTIPKNRNLRALMRRRLPAALFARLAETGRLADAFGVSAFAVGGLVRDLLLGRETFDVDVAVEGDGMAFARYAADRCGAGLKIFDRFATAYVVFPERLKLDIANTRAERPLNRQVPRPKAWRSIEQDLAARDFTINALAVRLNPDRFGRLLDPCGGARDLRTGTIRIVYERSFMDDPARIFRAVRFAQRFGFRIERKTLTLLRQAVRADLVHQLPDHRLGNEVMAILAEPHPARAVRLMAALNLLRFLHSDLTCAPGLDRLLVNVERTVRWWGKRFPDHPLDRALVSLMALLDGLNETTENAVLARLAIHVKQAVKARRVKRALAVVVRRVVEGRPLKPSEAYRLLCDLPDEGLALCVAQHPSTSMKQLVVAHLTRYRRTRLAIGGQSLAALGLKPGPRYRAVLDEVLNAKLDGTVKTLTEERELAKRLVAHAAG